jgi:hypothetical protein
MPFGGNRTNSRADAGHLAGAGHVWTSLQKRCHPPMLGADAFLFEMLRLDGAFAPGDGQMTSTTYTRIALMKNAIHSTRLLGALW